MKQRVERRRDKNKTTLLYKKTWNTAASKFRPRNRYHTKFNKFKRRYQEFAPALEDGQMMWRNLYYVALNGFMLFNSWGLNKR